MEGVDKDRNRGWERGRWSKVGSYVQNAREKLHFTSPSWQTAAE